ncbi:MaoC family dehydratase, partial [Chloroflexota bacterium]
MLENIKVKINEKKWEGHPRIIVGDASKLPEFEKVTPEILERYKFRMNKPFIPRKVFFNYEATRDTIRHFAEGIGDTNPLFSDEEYAKKTKYGRITAPASFLYTHQWTMQGGGLTGVHGWYVGADWEWYSPIYIGTKFSSVGIIREQVTKKGRMAGGKDIYIDYQDIVYLNAESGESLGKQHCHTVRA